VRSQDRDDERTALPVAERVVVGRLAAARGIVSVCIEASLYTETRTIRIIDDERSLP